MKISESAIAMQSKRSYAQISSTQSSVLGMARKEDTKSVAATLSLSKKPQTEKKADLTIRLKQLEKERKQMLKEQVEKQLKEQMDSSGKVSSISDYLDGNDEGSIQLAALKRMLEELLRMRRGESPRMQALKLRPTESPILKLQNNIKGLSSMQINGNGLPTSNVWTKQTVVSSFHAEMENTAFSTIGIVKTADGREINFNVQIEMSRSFMESNTFLKEENIILTDPLVINLDTNIASVSDQKFLFDLDGDGIKDEISFLGKGSGFLALDKNGDGIINDGNELFGTKSGNGFKDLAEYDQDGNGWIDENDEIFSQLRIWFKDETGEDRLIDLYEAGVGAIFLGNVSTEFSLKNQETNATNGIIRNTGIYLKESGEVGTIQHIDLAL